MTRQQILKKSIRKPYIHSANFEKSLLKADLFNFKPSTEETLDQVCEEPYKLKRLFSSHCFVYDTSELGQIHATSLMPS